MPKHDEQIQRIQEKLQRASRLPRKSSDEYLQEKDYANYYRFFGSDSHSFQMNGTLKPAEIDAWEVEHNAQLPEAYRAFLEKVGNGGAGPYYGVLSLAEWHDGIYIDDKTVFEQSLAQPCLLVDKPYEPDDRSWLTDIVGDDWEEKWNKEEWCPTFGTITLCHHGCSMYDYLILNGENRGRVCFIEWHLPPVFAKGNFLEWYESWLDKVLHAEQSA